MSGLLREPLFYFTENRYYENLQSSATSKFKNVNLPNNLNQKYKIMFRNSNPPTQNGYYSYFLIDDSAASLLRQFLSQILETTLEEGSTPMILTLSKTEFDALATAYHDLLVGYKHPRQDSMAFRFRERDETLQKLKKLYPQWLTCDDLPPQALVNYKSLSK